jgi:hypothetical protein
MIPKAVPDTIYYSNDRYVVIKTTCSLKLSIDRSDGGEMPTHLFFRVVTAN